MYDIYLLPKHLQMVDRPTCIIAAIWSTVTVFDSYSLRTSLTCFSSSLAGRPPFLPRARAASSPARVRSADQVAFELCEAAEDVEHERAARCAGVYRFGQGAEPHSPLVERDHQVDKVLHAPAEPVELPHHHGVALSQQVEHVVKFGTVGPRAGGHVSEDPVAPGPLERVLLQISGLVVGADSCVSVDHARHAPNHTTTRQWHQVSER